MQNRSLQNIITTIEKVTEICFWL